MKFWDSSGIVPFCVKEPTTAAVRKILREDPVMVVWWAARIECLSALTRRSREGPLDTRGEEQARAVLTKLAGVWSEVRPAHIVRDTAERLLTVHPLRTADALQLAAALVWAGTSPKGHDWYASTTPSEMPLEKKGLRCCLRISLSRKAVSTSRRSGVTTPGSGWRADDQSMPNSA